MSQNIKKQIDYLLKLTDKIGIIEHCCLDKPNYLEGYCTDDNARALQVCLRLKNKYPVLENVLPIYFNFLKSAIRDNGCHNDLNQDLTWKNDCNRNNEYYGRALVAIGELSNSENKLATEAKNIFDKLYSNVNCCEYVRIWSQVILGLKERQNYNDINQWADLILQTYEKQKRESWQWFESSISYDNGRVPMGLLTAYEVSKDKKYKTVALETLDFLTKIIYDNGRVTIGASKISTLDREAITIRNYQGRIFVGGGDGWWQSDTSQPLEIVHEGERPVDFVIAGQMWWRSEPLYRFGPGLRYASVENLLMENQYPQYNEMSLPNVTTPTTSAALIGALDDFRELGSHYLRYYFPE